MRWQTRAPCPATTYLSWLSCEPKRCPLALDNLPLRRLTPLEVVWRPGDPPVHYRPRPISCTARRSRPHVRLGRLLEFRYWKPLEHLDHILVRNLIKVSIIKADCAEELVVFKTDDIVSVVTQHSKAICRCYRHSEHEFFWITHAGGAQSCAGRRASGDAIVNHDRCATADINPLAAAQIALTPPFDFGEFGVADRVKFGFVDGELRLDPYADLAHQDQIERRMERG